MYTELGFLVVVSYQTAGVTVQLTSVPLNLSS